MSAVEMPSITGEKIAEVEEKAEAENKNEGTQVDEGYTDTEADLLLISSDGVRFRVHSYYLKAASPVFRSMIQNCTPTSPELRLSDEAIEKATIVRLLLNLMCNIPLGDFDSIDNLRILDLIRLADKWECPTVLQIIGLHAAKELGKSSDAHSLFYYACALDNVDVAHRLLPAAAKRSWTGPSPTIPSVHKQDKGSCVLDVTNMSSSWIDRLPRKYFLALLRASRLRMTEPKGSWESVADDFKALVKAYDTTAKKA